MKKIINPLIYSVFIMYGIPRILLAEAIATRSYEFYESMLSIVEFLNKAWYIQIVLIVIATYVFYKIAYNQFEGRRI